MDGLLRTSAKSALCEFKSAEMLHPALMSAMRVAGAAFEYPRERQQLADHVKTSNRGRNSICSIRTALDVMCQNERLIGTNHELMGNHGCQFIQ